MSLRIRVLRTLNECRAIRVDWMRLLHLEGRGTLGFDVSATFEWTEALWQGFAPDTPQLVLVAEDESGVRGILPCSITTETIGRVPHRKLALISSIYDLRTGFLVGGSAEVLAGLLAYIFDELEGWDSFVFKVVDGSPSNIAICDVLRQRASQAHVLRSWTSPYILVPAESAQVTKSLSSNLRSNVRRREKQLRDLGSFETRFYDTEASVPVFMDLLKVVEARSWKLDAGTALISSAKQEKLYDVVTPAMARQGWFLGAALLLDQQPIAYVYGYAFEGVFVGEKGSYDEQFKKCGPGSVLKAKILEELARREIRIYDMGGDADPNKALWTDKSFSRNLYLLGNDTPRGWLIRGSLRASEFWRALRHLVRTTTPSQ